MPPTHNIDAPRGTVDEAWIGDWVAFGLADCAAYLARHAAFARYLDRRAAPAACTCYPFCTCDDNLIGA